MPELNTAFIQQGSKLRTVNVVFSPQRSLIKEMWSNLLIELRLMQSKKPINVKM